MSEPWFSGPLLNVIAEADEWLDGAVGERYVSEPLAQDWARVAKVGEEVGEAISALIDWTGQNPRKPQRDEAREEMLHELADTAATAIFAMQHFTKDAEETADRLQIRFEFIHERMRASLAARDAHSQEATERES